MLRLRERNYQELSPEEISPGDEGRRVPDVQLPRKSRFRNVGQRENFFLSNSHVWKGPEAINLCCMSRSSRIRARESNLARFDMLDVSLEPLDQATSDTACAGIYQIFSVVTFFIAACVVAILDVG